MKNICCFNIIMIILYNKKHYCLWSLQFIVIITSIINICLKTHGNEAKTIALYIARSYNRIYIILLNIVWPFRLWNITIFVTRNVVMIGLSRVVYFSLFRGHYPEPFSVWTRRSVEVGTHFATTTIFIETILIAH